MLTKFYECPSILGKVLNRMRDVGGWALATDETNAVNEQSHSPEATAQETTQSTTVDEGALREVQTKADEYLAGWQRERADFANYKRRIEREMRESFVNGGLETIKQLLPLVDDFERALQNVPSHLEGEPWLQGTELLLNKLHKMLAEYNVEVMDPMGEAFDPSRHQAVAMDDSGAGESGHVTEVLQKGYICGERVLRAAMVKVAV